MSIYWVTMKDGSAGCVEASDKQQAIHDAQEHTGKVFADIQILPYPASPRWGKVSNFPSFCFSPQTCKGHSSCPRRISCVE